MKVAAFERAGSIKIEERSSPHAGEGEVVLALRLCGLCGTDLFKLRDESTAKGIVLGHELVGVVEEVGDGVTKFTRGQRVVVPHHVACGNCSYCRRGSETLCATFRENLMEPGGFSEKILIRRRAVEQAARIVPDHLTDEQAIFLEPGACVVRGIHRSAILGGEDRAALIVGGGGMGLLHLLILKAMAPSARIVVTDLRQDRLALAKELGAASAVLPSDASEAIAKLTNREGVDAVFDTVGGAPILNDSIRNLREGGTVILFAHGKPKEQASFELNDLFKSEKRVIATYSGSLREQDEMWELLTSLRVDPTPLITHRLPLERFAEGVAIAERQEALKVAFTAGDSSR